MSPIDETSSFDPEPPVGAERKRKSPRAENGPQAAARLVTITVDAGAGRVVGIGGLDAAGQRRDLSDDERTALAEQASTATLRDIVEQAFEAGIGCVLGRQAAQLETPESEFDADLSRVLLRSLISRSDARRLMQFDVLGPAIVGSLIERARHRDAQFETGADH